MTRTAILRSPVTNPRDATPPSATLTALEVLPHPEDAPNMNNSTTSPPAGHNIGPEAARPANAPTLDRVSVEAVVAAASRAPSLHNTQPWQWVLRGDGLDLRADR